MRIGVIGCGSIGTRHALNLKALRHEVLIDDADSDRVFILAEILRQCGLAKIGGPFESLQPDAVLICTPASTHAQVASGLLKHGYAGPLFVEKPLALSLAECDVFRSWPHVVTQVGYMLRFHPKARAMKLLFPSRDIYYGSFHCSVNMDAWPGTGYGPLCLEASHELDLACWLGAPPLSKATIRANEVRLEFRKEEWSCPWHVQIFNATSNYLREWDLSACGDTGAEAIFESADELGDQMYVDELAHFLACVERNEPTITPFADGIRVVEVCEQALKLAKANA